MKTQDFIVVLTTLPADSDAETLASTLVQERLAACVNVLAEMDSVYRWEGQVELDRERQIIIKTTTACVEPLWERVRELHPHEVPEFLVLPIIDGNDAYLRWMHDSTQPGGDEAGGEET